VLRATKSVKWCYQVPGTHHSLFVTKISESERVKQNNKAMKQLLSSSTNCFVVGLKDCVFAVFRSTDVVQLVGPTKSEPEPETGILQDQENDGDASSAKEGSAKQQNKDLEPKDVQSVAIYRDEQAPTTIWCAASRGDKSLEIYSFEEKADTMSVTPSLVYKTPKRVGCMCFGTLASDDTSTRGNPCLIAGDVAGDAYAYNLTTKGTRLLLGHTASMLTGVHVFKDRLLTGDRDEKIRVSRFPESYEIDGYLLGHEAYVTSLAVALQGPNAGMVASCGGDSTIRMWNLESLSQCGEISIENDTGNQEGEKGAELIPTDLAISQDGSNIAVIFDQSNRLDVYQVDAAGDNKKSIKLVKTMICPSQPLSVTIGNDSEEVLAVMRDPDYIMGYSLKDGDVTPSKIVALDALREKATEKKIKMPETILDKDDAGLPKLRKLEETRGPAQADAPWNRVQRLETERGRTQRRKKRKRDLLKLEKES
jgi:tRNA (guanine-N(7)-)-methyltransferase subunit TRM82